MGVPLPDASAWHFPAEMVGIPGSPRVVVAPEPGAGRLTAQWLFDAGANDEAAAAFGLSHLVEHLAFGPIGAPDAPDFDERLGALGGTSDGWTDRERMGWGATVPVSAPEDALALVKLEGERWRGLVIDDAAVVRQRSIVRQELAETIDWPHGLDRPWLDQLLWSAGEPWSRHPQSPPAEASTVAEAQARWLILRDRAVLVLAGEIDPAAVTPALQAAFAGTTTPEPPRPVAKLGDPGCEPGPPAVTWRKANVAEGAVYLAWPVPGRDHPDRVALEAIARWMGGARLSAGAGCGELVVERRGTWWSMHRHVTSIRRAIAAIARDGLDPGSVDRTRIAQLTDLARAVGSLDVRARAAAGCVLADRAPDCLADEADAWIHLDPAATQHAAARWLEPEATTVLAVVPPDTLFAPPIPGIARRPW